MNISEAGASVDERDLKPNMGLGEEDRDGMNAIGKKQVFKRRFNFWSALGLTVCISATVRVHSINIIGALLIMHSGKECQLHYCK